MASSRMIALLGLLAVAGYQNRDKLSEVFGSTRERDPNSPGDKTAQTGGIGGMLGSLGGMVSGALSGRDVPGSLKDLLDDFRKTGHAQQADSWVANGPNRQLSATDLEDALGSTSIEELSKQTGLQRDELLRRLSEVLPAAVDRLTPDGRIPS